MRGFAGPTGSTSGRFSTVSTLRPQAPTGSPLWYKWTDFRDEAERELLDELEQIVSRLNMRAHRIERAPASVDGTAIICSFASETEMVVFKVGASAVW